MSIKMARWPVQVKDKRPIDGRPAARFYGQMAKSFGEAVLEAMEARGWSVAELHRRSGVSYDVINKFKHRPGGSTKADNARKLAAALDLDWPDDDHAPAPVEVANGDPTPDGARLVPVYDVEASAGHGAVVGAEDHVSNLAFGIRYLREMTSAGQRDLAAIRVKGESMEPTLLDDDMVLIDLTKTNLDYDGLFVLRYGEALQVKRVGRGSKRGTVMVIADNRSYPPVEVERVDLDVVGKVLWYGRKV